MEELSNRLKDRIISKKLKIMKIMRGKVEVQD